MWIPGPTRAVLLSTVVIGLLLIFAVYATLQVSNDVRVVYEAEPYHPVAHGPVYVPPVPPPPLPKMRDPPENVLAIVDRNVRDREGAFWVEQVAFKKGRDFLDLTRVATFSVGEGHLQKTYRFSDYVATQGADVYNHFVVAHQFYGNVYERDWVAPTIPTPRQLGMLPLSVQGRETDRKLWRAAYAYFFGNGILNALFRYWQDRKNQLRRAHMNGDESLLDDLPHNP